MILWHYTSTYHLPLILESGVLMTTESNASPDATHAAPDVVWLLDTPELGGFGHGLLVSFKTVDKTEVRFQVDAPDAWVRPWRDWIAMNAGDRAWIGALADTAGGPEATRHWVVCLRPIPRDRWLRIERRSPKGVWKELSPKVSLGGTSR
jgi:hypothetical protein